MKSKIVIAVFIAALIAGCKKDKGESNDEELITTVILTFTPQGGGAVVDYQFEDLDGPGGTAPIQETITLEANKTYDVTVALWNKSITPGEDITEEVDEENTAHRFYYEPGIASNITVTNLDNDDDGVPLGITSTWATGAAATGSIKITLRHYPGTPPDKQAADPVNSPKSGTDIEVTFATDIN